MKKQWENAELISVEIKKTEGMTPWHGNEHDFNGDGVINSADEKAWKKAGRPLPTQAIS